MGLLQGIGSGKSIPYYVFVIEVVVMYEPNKFSRIEKLFIDKDNILPKEAEKLLKRHDLVFRCGHDVVHKPGLQAALLTALNIGSRAFRGKITVCCTNLVAESSLLVPWRKNQSLQEAVRDVAPRANIQAFCSEPKNAYTFLLGETESRGKHVLRISYDGWRANVSGINVDSYDTESEGFILSGILAGAIAISEVFMHFSGISPYATRRNLKVSLWNLDSDGAANGPTITYLPSEAWLLGLGHLGQAFAWCLSMLPYTNRHKVKLILQDFDTIEDANFDTGVLTFNGDLGILKTRVVDRFLTERGFHPRLVERSFHEGVRVQKDDPALAFCGFDGNGPRSILDEAGFSEVIECGLGGGYDDFHSIVLHSLPNPEREAKRIWPVQINASGRAKSLENHHFYKQVAAMDGCGHIMLASQAIAVPFVGVAAACFALAESIRILHGGPRYGVLNCDMRRPDRFISTALGRNSRPIRYQDADTTNCLAMKRRNAS